MKLFKKIFKKKKAKEEKKPQQECWYNDNQNPARIEGNVYGSGTAYDVAVTKSIFSS